MRILLLAGILVSCAPAQGPTEPPPLLELIRKPGTGAAPRPYSDARAAVDVIGLAALTGEPETWYLEQHYSFASIEDLDKGLRAATPASPSYDPSDPFRDNVLAPPRTMLGELRTDLSYRPDQAVRAFPRARYFHISVYRIRAGTEADFAELVKLRRLSQDSVNLDRPEIAYAVISGAPSGTYLFLSPLASLRSLDEGVAETPVYAQGIAEARNKARAKVAPDAELHREHLLFRVEPRLSYVSDSFAAADPGFWRGKPDGQ